MRELCQRMSAVTMELNLKFMLTIQTIVCQLLCHFLTLQDQQIGFLTLSWKIRTGNLYPIFFIVFNLFDVPTLFWDNFWNLVSSTQKWNCYCQWVGVQVVLPGGWGFRWHGAKNIFDIQFKIIYSLILLNVKVPSERFLHNVFKTGLTFWNT